MSTSYLRSTLAAAALVSIAPIGALAAPVTDVQDYSNNTATEYFVPNDAQKYNSPWYRNQNQDWGWKHGAIAGTGFTSIKLEISAFDVDKSAGEIDRIRIFAGSGTGFVEVLDLAGGNDVWAFSTVDLTGYSWAEAQVNAGLEVFMNIDVNNQGWLVTLGKAVLSVDGGNQSCVPTPGVPCTPTVPEPGTLALLGLALGGLALTRRRALA